MPLHRLKNRGATVFQQVPPVSDMEGIRRTAPAAVGVGCTPVAGDHLYAGAVPQPGCEAVRLSVGQ